MTTRTGKGRAANIAMALVAIVGLLVPAIIGVIAGVATDTTLRAGNVGTFVSSSTSVGGLFTPTATTVQTSTGSVVVSGSLSALRGQELRVEDRIKSGLQLCVQTTPATCADVTGQWTGPMQPVQYQHHASTWILSHIGITGAMSWFFFGLIATLVAVVKLADAGGWSQPRVDGEGIEQADRQVDGES